jgi:hypothetical protein
MSRIGITTDTSNRCSIYYALFNHNVIDKKLFDDLEGMSSKINYNKKWLIDELSPTYIIYASYDVMYLYDLLDELSNRMIPYTPLDSLASTENKQYLIDVVSLVNRLYRFHMINRLQISNISIKCKKILDMYIAQKKITKNNTKDNEHNLPMIDQKIMEVQICRMIYKYNKIDELLDVYMEDVLSIDTIRNTILCCLRVYRLNISVKDIKYVDHLFSASKTFNYMKGHESIIILINIIKEIVAREINHIECNRNLLVPK